MDELTRRRTGSARSKAPSLFSPKRRRTRRTVAGDTPVAAAICLPVQRCRRSRSISLNGPRQTPTASATASGVYPLVTCRTVRSRPRGVSRAFLCTFLRFFFGIRSFRQLRLPRSEPDRQLTESGPERSAALNAVETRFKLPPDQVDMLITAGHDLLITNGVFRKFLNSLGQQPAPSPSRNGPVAAPTARLHQAEAQ